MIALGKFGGRELLYGADLDVVFIGQDVTAGAQLIQAMGAKMANGAVFPMDGGLRPDGEKGVLVDTSRSLSRIFREPCSLLGGASPDQSPRRVRPGVANHLMTPSPKSGHAGVSQRRLETEIAKMYRRIVKERAKGDDLWYFKTGKGGLIGIEFLVQYLQMKHLVPETEHSSGDRQTSRRPRSR